MSSTVQKQSVKANGYEYLVRTAGLDNDGEFVILLHGFPESSIIWEPLMVKLADKGYRVIAPDQRGYSTGARPAGMEHYTVRFLAEDVLGFADAFGVDGKFHLVGHDWGCSVGWTCNILFPERIQSYTAMSTPYNPAFLWAMMNDPDQQAKSFYIRDFQVPDVPEETLAKDDYAWLRHYWEGFAQENIDDFLTIFSTWEGRNATINWYRALFAIKNDFEYTPITTPTIYIWGNEDVALGRAGAEMTAQFMQGEYEFIELNAGHWLMEFNEEEVSALIMKHIEAHPISE